MPTTGGTVQRRGLVLVDFFRNTTLGGVLGTWRVAYAVSMDTTMVANDLTHEMLIMHQALYGGRNPSEAIGNGVVWTSVVNVPGGGANEENDGYLDCVSIYYAPQGFPIEIYDLIVYRLR